MRIQLFDYTVDLLESILWQYNEATNLVSLLNQKQDWYNINQTAFWQNWFNQVFNLPGDHLNLFGTAVWSIILGEPLLVPIFPESPNKPIWGFNNYNPSFPTLENSYVNFSFGNFSTHGESGLVELTVEEQQFLLRLRYFDLTTRGDITDINYFLAYLCATSNIGYNGTIYALDGFNMTMTYVFTEKLPADLLTALQGPPNQGLDILPRPATVGERLVINTGGNTFGFNKYDPAFPKLENTYVNFNNGNFFTGVY